MNLLKRESLLDTIGERSGNFLLVYSKNSPRLAWFTRWIDREFEHVEVWQDLGLGYYLRVQPYHDVFVVDMAEGAPDGRVQRVRAKRIRRDAMFPFGLKTCVSVAKTMLGIRNPFIVTPWQLFRYVEKRKGVV